MSAKKPCVKQTVVAEQDSIAPKANAMTACICACICVPSFLQMVMLLREYVDSDDSAEAMRCLKELDVPHFHHELVYQAAVLAIEDSTDTSADKMTSILKFLTITNIITPDQLRKVCKLFSR